MVKEVLKMKKRMLIYLLSAVMGTTLLSGCSNSNFEYLSEEDGTVTVASLISYDILKGAKLVHLTNELAEIDKYFIVLYNSGKYSSEQYYYDIETGVKVYSETTDDFKNFDMDVILEQMVDFLYKYDMVKDEYSIEDVKKLKQLLLDEEKLFEETLEESSVKILEKKKVRC